MWRKHTIILVSGCAACFSPPTLHAHSAFDERCERADDLMRPMLSATPLYLSFKKHFPTCLLVEKEGSAQRDLVHILFSPHATCQFNEHRVS
jgi:hypothetical protein